MARKNRHRYDQQSRRMLGMRALRRRGYVLEICLTIPGEPPEEPRPGAAFFAGERAEPTTPARAMGSSTSSDSESLSGHPQGR